MSRQSVRCSILVRILILVPGTVTMRFTTKSADAKSKLKRSAQHFHFGFNLFV